VRLAVGPGRELLAARTGYTLGADACALAAVDKSGRVRGVVGFDRWTPASVHLHVVLESPAAVRVLLPAAFAEAFAGGRVLARGEVRASNARSLALVRHLGFAEAHRVRDGWAPGEDMVLFEMRREACRWLKEAPHG
jgi:RimJ/RimL family protein N-acetyltransferase